MSPLQPIERLLSAGPSGLVDLIGGGSRLMVVDVTAVVELLAGINRSRFMVQGCLKVLAPVGVLHRGRREVLVGGVVIADSAVLEFGHGIGPRRVGL